MPRSLPPLDRYVHLAVLADRAFQEQVQASRADVQLPDEKGRRVGQATAAVSLPGAIREKA